jgi:hypothetical protein
LISVYTAEDTHLAIAYGVDGIIVSNHGGRQLDSATATLDALPECVEAAAGRIPVHLESAEELTSSRHSLWEPRSCISVARSSGAWLFVSPALHTSAAN